MESFMDDLLNFTVPEENEDDDDDDDEGELEEEVRQSSGKKMARRKKGRPSADPFGLIDPNDPGLIEEEDLEWISNKDAFPVIETFVGVLPSDHLGLASPERLPTAAKQLSPVSVLETSSQSTTTSTTTTMTTTTTNSSGGSNGITAAAAATNMMSCCGGLSVPVKARSKRRRTGRCDFRALCIHHEQASSRKKPKPAAAIGRKCLHCGAEKTPQWRAGPAGPKTLCNACGVRYKSGRLVPEYRPASSPTFSAKLHSNSHRKILEMRRQLHVGATSFPATGKAVDKG